MLCGMILSKKAFLQKFSSSKTSFVKEKNTVRYSKTNLLQRPSNSKNCSVFHMTSLTDFKGTIQHTVQAGWYMVQMFWACRC